MSPSDYLKMTSGRRIEGMTHDEIARYIMETAITISEGWRKDSREAEIASSNTGTFILLGLGWKFEEIKKMALEIRKETN